MKTKFIEVKEITAFNMSGHDALYIVIDDMNNKTIQVKFTPKQARELRKNLNEANKLNLF